MATIKVKRSAVAGRIPATTDLELGEIAINTYDGVAYIKKSVSGTDSVVQLGSANLSQNLQNRYQYTATAAQTTFAAVYLAPYVDVYLNGIRLIAGVDYTATNGTTVVLTTAASLNNTIDIVAYTSYTANANFADLASIHVTTALGYTPENPANKGVANGYASLNSSGQIPSAQLPSFVDDVVEYANLAALPATGESGKIYVTQDTNKTYRWSGSAYTEIASSPGSTDAVTEGSSNLYFTNARARNALSATQNLTYSSSTGVFTGPDLSGYLTSATAASVYAPLANPSFTGDIATAGQIILNNNNYIGFKNNTGFASCSIFQDTSNDLWLYNGGATNTRFYTSATERFRIGSSGQWGLSGANYGTSGQVLTSQGSGSAPIWAAAGGGGSAATPTTLGTVYGKQTTSGASAYLTAYGYEAATSTTGSYNTANGYRSLYTNTTGSQNTAYGVWSMYLTTTGSNNTAVGMYAMNANTTGGNNVAIGLSALESNTTASNNTAVGYQAGYSNTTNANNTYVGAETGYFATGVRNTAIGRSALYGTSSGTNTGTDNTALGYLSMTLITSGSYNTAVGGGDGSGAGNPSMYRLTTGSYNIAVGNGSLGNSTTASNNVALGYQALYSNTTASGNTAVGYQSLYTNTTAPRNIAMGYQAGYSNAGANNLFIGYQAGFTNTTGTGNSFVGGMTSANWPAGYYNTTGSDNNAFGGGALRANTTGSFNTAVGTDALHLNTTANYNVALGYQAGYSNTTGAQFTAIGYQALYSNTTAADNTAVGFQALYSNTTGDISVAVGRNALRAQTTATQNTAIGYNAANKITTSSYNVAIGQAALGSMVNGAQGNVALGQGALAAYVNTSVYEGGAVAVGQGALQYCTTGGSNVAMGRNAGHNLTTGATNVIIGDRAGEAANSSFGVYLGAFCGLYTTGNYNTFLGWQAGHYETSTTTGTSNVYVGAGAKGSGVSNTNEIVVGAFATGKGSNTGFINPGNSGVYQGNNSSSWSTTSDQRLKKNIVDNNIGLDAITAIRVRNFEYRLPEEVDTELKPADAVIKSGVQLGVIAQELQAVLPECVKQESTGVLSVDTDNLTWYLINAVKELSARVKQLEGN